MVLKSVLLELFDNEVKKTLQIIEGSKKNIDIYIKSVERWFVNYKKDEIDKSGFEMFLKFLDKETNKLLKVISSDTKPKVINALSVFLVEIKEHSSEDVIIEIKEVIKNIGGVDVKKNKDFIGFFKRWKVMIFILVVIIVFIAGAYVLIGPSDELDVALNQSSIQNENPEVLETAHNDPKIRDEEIRDDESIKENVSLQPNLVSVFSPIERQVYDLINNQRKLYYVQEFKIDRNYTMMIKNNTLDIAERLGIEAFIYENDEELSLKGDDIPLAIYTQMNKRNLFDKELKYIAIRVDEVAYKIYRIRIAYY